MRERAIPARLVDDVQVKGQLGVTPRLFGKAPQTARSVDPQAVSVPDTTPAATLRFAWKSDAVARATRAEAQSAGATASAYATFGKNEGEARGRKGERRIAERKRKREKHVEKAIEDTTRKEGRRGTDMRS